MSAQTQINQVYPIGRVSELTGVNSVTLRAWERRYGLIQPARSSSGHRLYSESDIQLIGYVLEQLERGIPISGVARQLQLKNTESEPQPDNLSLLKNRMATAAHHFDEKTLDNTYSEAMALFPVTTVLDHIVVPVLRDLEGNGEKTAEGQLAVSGFYRIYVRNKLGAQFHHAGRIHGAQSIVSACLPEESDDLGLLLFGLRLKSRAFNAILLGNNTPLHEIPTVVTRTRAAALMLAGSDLGNCAERTMQIAGLTSTLNVPVFVGGIVSRACLEQVQGAGAVPIGQDLLAGIRIITNALSPGGETPKTPEVQ